VVINFLRKKEEKGKEQKRNGRYKVKRGNDKKRKE